MISSRLTSRIVIVLSSAEIPNKYVEQYVNKNRDFIVCLVIRIKQLTKCFNTRLEQCANAF